MNGLSFADFEGASFDSLYQRGFAGAKTCDEAMKNMKPEDLRALGGFDGRSRAALGGGSAAPQAGTQRVALAAPSAQRESLPFSGAGRRLADDPVSRPAPSLSQSGPVPLNDIGAMPGNTRVDHTWTPSREATAAARHAPPASSAQPLPQPPAGGGHRGQFVGWKSN
mmetsp:Transcript_123762/g.357988  ORF Transcript_123762/g.357988 Transcript_123762/m.357988 type:complete len:167 (-) Transcript_123762:149-649(-)